MEDYVSKYTAKEVDAKLQEVFASTLQTKEVSIEGGSSMEVVPDEGYLALAKVNVSAKAKPKYTGHADAEGLRAIGWTDEDIEYYQANGVNWNEEEDEYHKVSDDNKALYGVLTADNISTYKYRIVYLPKIDTSAKTSMYNMFSDCSSLVSIPQLDTSNVMNMNSMFYRCYSLVSIPQLNTAKVTNMNNMFLRCYSLVSIPQLDTSKVTVMYSMFDYCYSLVSIPQLDTSSVASMSNIFSTCYSLTTANLKNLKRNYELYESSLLSKDSLLYIINNEAAESAITITLHSYAYQRLAEDADIVAALANHPNISLASA